jgi:hypothetical protein
MKRTRLALHLVLGIAAAACQQPPADADAAARNAVIEGVLTRLQASYVLPRVAGEMDVAVRGRHARGEYDGLPLDQTLADSLTAHLRAVSHDKHLEVVFSPEPFPSRPADADPSKEELREMAEAVRQERFGVEGTEILEGNVGLLDLRAFVHAEVPGADEAVADAMRALAGTDALIIDLRRNRGGEPSMVQLVASYLFGPEPVQLSSIYWRPADRTEERWTLRRVRGPRYGAARPVYVLTSSGTFSAGEALAYDLKSLRRATIVGETTAGGAHPGGMESVTEHFAVRVPSGRAINPVTGTNWEGTGVQPDVPVHAGAALPTAHLAAVRALLTTASGRDRAALERLVRQMDTER